MRVSFLGIGNMGAPLARNILDAGEDLTIFTRRPEAAAAFAGAGAKVAPEVKALAACDLLCTCLPLPEHVRKAMLGPNGLYSKMSRGAVHLEFSTIAPETANELKKAAEERGIAYVQATVSKSPAVAAKKEAPLFVGGDAGAMRKLWPLLEKIAKPEDVGSVDAACGVKLLSNMIGMSNIIIMAQALAVGHAGGMDLERLRELLEKTGAWSNQMDVRGPWIAAGDFRARFAVDLAAKDLRLGCAMAREWGSEPGLIAEALKILEKAGREGLGGEDVCAVYKMRD